jgi:hypothetical protein
MISQTILLWLGSMALLADYVGLARAENLPPKLMTWVFALVFWLAFTQNSLAFTVTEGGEVFTRSAETLQLIGILGTVTTLVLLFMGVFEAFKNGGVAGDQVSGLSD